MTAPRRTLIDEGQWNWNMDEFACSRPLACFGLSLGLGLNKWAFFFLGVWIIIWTLEWTMRNYWKHHEICISRLGTAYAHPMHRWSVACQAGRCLKDIFGKFDGYLSPSQDLKFADVPSGLAAISKVPLEGWLQVLLVAGLIETQLFKDSLGPSFVETVVCWIQLKRWEKRWKVVTKW